MVRDSRRVMAHYARSGRLAVDVIACLPYGRMVTSSPANQYVILLVLLKLVYLMKYTR